MANNNDKFISRENAKTLWGYMIDLLTGKQNKLTFDDTPTQSSDNPVKSGGIFTALAGKGTYSKPQNGIPKTDLENAVQTSLGLADSALQSETDPTVPSWAKQTNKPSYTQDEVGDGTTYKRVNQTEKDTWNAKGTYSKPSSGIPKSDLASAVQTSLEKADSALQSETDPTVPSWAKQSSKPSYNSDEISDTNKTHKFATQEQLNQISTNQTNILSAESMVCDNTFSTSTAYAEGDIVTYNHKLYKFKTAHSAGAWNSSHVDQISTTGLITPELIELCDSGAKNVAPMTWTNADPFADIHMTKNSDDSITVTATNTAATRIIELATNLNTYLTVGKKYVLSGCDDGNYTNHYGFALSTSNYTGRVFEADGSEEFTYVSEVVNFTLVVRAGESWTKTFKPMICTQAAWNVSHKYVPYRPNWDLVASTVASTVKVTKNINSSYTLISDLTYTSVPNTTTRITAIVMNSGKIPKGIIISRTNVASDIANAANLIAKSEVDYDCRQLQVDGVVTDGSATTYYIWAKVEETNSTMVKRITQILG